jgi:hypothetical protein
LDLHSAAVFDSHMPCRAHAVSVSSNDHAFLKATFQGQGTERHGHGWISIGRPETACGLPARVWLLSANSRISTKVVIRSTAIRETVGLAFRIFPASTRTFTEDTALSENGRGAARHVWINAERHGHGLGSAWAWHDMYELGFNSSYKVPTSSCRSERDDGVEITFLKIKLQSLLWIA